MENTVDGRKFRGTCDGEHGGRERSGWRICPVTVGLCLSLWRQYTSMRIASETYVQLGRVFDVRLCALREAARDEERE
jgi:hypothetical protein